MTRPKERLYIFSKYLPISLRGYERKENLNSFLYNYSDKFPVILGDPELMYESTKDFKKNFKISRRKKLNWQDVISLKHTAEDIWNTETSDTKRDWGKLLHLVLSNIHYEHQKDQIIDDMYKLGKFSKADYQKLQKVIAELLSHHDIQIFFNDSWYVKNEKEILMSNGKTYIPDRLLFSRTNDKVVIIDYKTGNESNKHIIQINDYADALMLMGKSNIDRVLVYISEDIKVLRL
jgi:ATP-dependent exoDNAse (exonuclease V) beta subunit